MSASSAPDGDLPEPPIPTPDGTTKPRGSLVVRTMVVVIVLLAAALIVGLALLISRSGESENADPTTTATVAGDASPWLNNLPDPCAGVPDSAIRAAGLDPSTRFGEHGRYAHFRSCGYRSPLAHGAAPNPTVTWEVQIIFQTQTYRERLDSPSTIDVKPTELHGQPASYYRTATDRNPPNGLHKCGVIVGTTFGSAAFYVSDNVNSRMSQERVCGTAWQVANQIQPFIPHEAAPK